MANTKHRLFEFRINMKIKKVDLNSRFNKVSNLH
jgi:hypothetical protein